MASKGLRVSTQPVAGWHFRTFLSFGLRSPFSFYRVCLELGRLTIGVLEALPYEYCKARRFGPHAKIPRLESLQAQLGSSPAHSSGLRYWYQLAKSTRS